MDNDRGTVEESVMANGDGILLRSLWFAQGQLWFLRPMAAVTAFTRHAVGAFVARVKHWHERTPNPPRARKELAIRQLEEYYARATDLHDLERMERAYNRRDGGGMRTWDWR